MTTALSFNAKYLTPLRTYGQQGYNFSKEALRLTFDQKQFNSFQENLTNSVKGAVDPTTGKRVGGVGLQNIGENTKNAWKTAANEVKGTSFWKNTWESIKGIGPDIKAGFKGGTFKGLKSIGSVLVKRMPLLMNVATIAFEAPNIYKAFTSPNGGIVTGLKELGKAAVRVSLTAIGAAVGTALGGIVGGMALGCIGSVIATKLTGKTFSENEAEKLAKGANPEIPSAGGQNPALPNINETAAQATDERTATQPQAPTQAQSNGLPQFTYTGNAYQTMGQYQMPPVGQEYSFNTQGSNPYAMGYPNFMNPTGLNLEA